MNFSNRKERYDMQNNIAIEMNKRGLERVSESISENIRNSVRLISRSVKEEKMELGKTKIGGKPDVPEGFVWPEWKSGFLSFIAQINLSEVAKYDTEKLLPTTGILYFFYDANQETWGFDPEDVGSSKVIYFDGDMSGLKRIDFPEDLDEEEGIFKACRVDIKSEMSLPGFDSAYVEELELDCDEEDAYFDFCEEKNDDEIINKILGNPDQVQEDMLLQCQLASNGIFCGDDSVSDNPRVEELKKGMKDWRLLLQIDSDENCEMMWGDVGRIYFWIKTEDLKNRNFDKVWLVLQCG